MEWLSEQEAVILRGWKDTGILDKLSDTMYVVTYFSTLIIKFTFQRQNSL